MPDFDEEEERERLLRAEEDERARMIDELIAEEEERLEAAQPDPLQPPQFVQADVNGGVAWFVAPPGPQAAQPVDHISEEDFRKFCPGQQIYQEWDGGDITDWCYQNHHVWLDNMWVPAIAGNLLKKLNGFNCIYNGGEVAPRLRRAMFPPILEPVPDYVFEEEEMTRKLPPFKLPYATVEEASLRLRNTIIMIKKDPVLVYEVGGDRKNIELFVLNSEGKRSRLPLEKVPDFRSPAPGYIEYGHTVCYLSRIPDRIFQQGLNSKNGQLREVNKKATFEINLRDVLPGLKNRCPVRWSDKVADRLEGALAVERAVRLSDHVAAYRSKKGQTSIEYRGRYLGILRNGCVNAGDPGDLMPTWIMHDLAEVGLELRG